MKKSVIFLFFFFFTTFAFVAQEENLRSRDYRIKAGFSIGGTTPMPLPAEIRKIKGFNPLLNLMIGAEVRQSLHENWSLLSGLQFEVKGMETRAQVKNYNLTMVSDDDGEISGAFTGTVRTRVKNSYLTLPLLAMWQPDRESKWGIKAGVYGSFLLDGEFNGSTYDGYLREGDPTGERIDITTASYEFSKELRRWNWGALLGAEWRPFPNLLTGIDLSWGINSILKKDFDVISYNMYPIYGTVSFGYLFSKDKIIIN